MIMENNEMQNRALGDALVRRLGNDPMFRQQILVNANAALKEAGLLSQAREVPVHRGAGALHSGQRENACPWQTLTTTV